MKQDLSHNVYANTTNKRIGEIAYALGWDVGELYLVRLMEQGRARHCSILGVLGSREGTFLVESLTGKKWCHFQEGG